MKTLEMMIVLVAMAVAAALLVRAVYFCLAARYHRNPKTNLVVASTLFSVTCLLAAAAVIAVILQVSLVVAAL